MTQKIIDILNNLNKQFYDETGSIVWNQKPDYYWEGWFQLTGFINKKHPLVEKGQRFSFGEIAENDKSPIPLTGGANDSQIVAVNKIKSTVSTTYKILDLGCGNARFANFINLELTIEQVQNIDYLGIDFSVNFLEKSKISGQQKFAKYQLKQIDLLKELDQLKDSKFDLVVMFGLIHHIPSLVARKQFFKSVVELLNPRGMMIFTTWQYLDTPRLIKRVVDPETETGQYVYKRLGIQKTDLEIGDNILDWVKKVFSYRYSHYFSEEEIQGYIVDNNLELIYSFVCDGRDSKRNKYYICKVK